MAIPKLNENGLLPNGIHECTIEEVKEKFGQFHSSDKRQLLFNNLVKYIKELKETGIGKYLIINGSFVTNKEIPNDIDILLVLNDNVDLNKEVPPFKYNVRSKSYIKKNYPFDFFWGFDNHDSSLKPIKLFQRVKLKPGLSKGILKVIL